MANSRMKDNLEKIAESSGLGGADSRASDISRTAFPDPSNCDTPSLAFKTEVRAVKYGDGRTFFEYKILIFHQQELVGIEEGERRSAVDRTSALYSARRRIRFLRSRRLFVIRVTKKHISDGEARSCSSCAIAQALWHNQERMGLAKWEYSFEVVPYACFVDPRGIVLQQRYHDRLELRIPASEMPDMAECIIKGRAYSTAMEEWAMSFDDWAESRYMSLKEWRENHGYRDGERPSRPNPTSFVLDLDAFRTDQAPDTAPAPVPSESPDPNGDLQVNPEGVK